MDCETFDRVVLDLLYDELDEIMSAAVHRHLAHCTRCRTISARLRATREVGALSLLELPPHVIDRILAAEKTATKRLPLRQRVGRTITILAGYAMRPQLGMAAVLLFMIGAGLLLLRARPGERESIHVTERGVPEPHGETIAVLPVLDRDHASTESGDALTRKDRSPRRRLTTPEKRGNDQTATGQSAAAATHSDAGHPLDAGTATSAFQAALTAYHAQRYTEARDLFDRAASGGGAEAPAAQLYAARSVKMASGCAEAIERFTRLAAAHPDTDVGQDATWNAAECLRDMGRRDSARAAYTELLEAPRYELRAKAALNSLGETSTQSGVSEAQGSAPLGAPAPSGPAPDR